MGVWKGLNRANLDKQGSFSSMFELFTIRLGFTLFSSAVVLLPVSISTRTRHKTSRPNNVNYCSLDSILDGQEQRRENWVELQLDRRSWLDHSFSAFPSPTSRASTRSKGGELLFLSLYQQLKERWRGGEEG